LVDLSVGKPAKKLKKVLLLHAPHDIGSANPDIFVSKVFRLEGRHSISAKGQGFSSTLHPNRLWVTPNMLSRVTEADDIIV